MSEDISREPLSKQILQAEQLLPPESETLYRLLTSEGGLTVNEYRIVLTPAEYDGLDYTLKITHADSDPILLEWKPPYHENETTIAWFGTYFGKNLTINDVVGSALGIQLLAQLIHKPFDLTTSNEFRSESGRTEIGDKHLQESFVALKPKANWELDNDLGTYDAHTRSAASVEILESALSKISTGDSHAWDTRFAYEPVHNILDSGSNPKFKVSPQWS